MAKKRKILPLFACSVGKNVYLCGKKQTTDNRLKTKDMKRKDLKKHINYLCGELLAECIAAADFSDKDNKQDIENVVMGILGMQNDWIGRLSHVEPGSTKLFFKKLKEDMQKRTDEIVEQIQNL